MLNAEGWVDYYFPPKIHFEADCSHKVGSFTKHLGSRILLVSFLEETNDLDELTLIKTSLERHSDGVIIYDHIDRKPQFSDIDSAVYFSKVSNVNCIIGYGGFESINIAKIVSLLINNQFFTEELFQNKQHELNHRIPLVLIPNIPLGGLECSPSVIIRNDKNEVEYYQNDNLFPDLIISDPKLIYNNYEVSMSIITTISVAMEALLSKYSNNFTRTFPLKVIETISSNFRLILDEPMSLKRRESIVTANLLNGMAISRCSYGLIFGISLSIAEITNMDILKAMIVLLPHIMEYTLTTNANTYILVAKALNENTVDLSVIEAAIKAVEGIRKMYIELNIPLRLSDYEIRKIDLPKIASMCVKLPFLASFPRSINKNEIESILVAAF